VKVIKMVNLSTNLRVIIYYLIVVFIVYEINKDHVDLLISAIFVIVAVIGYIGLIRAHGET
jgi:hypothetical protein